mgnify:CR=1 FL=1
MQAAERSEDPADLFLRLEQLNDIGVALSRETDIDRLLETILVAAKNITNADGGTLYRVTEERTLKFEIMRNDTLGIAMGGTTGVAIPFLPIALYDSEGVPVTSMVAAYAVHHDRSVNIEDAYSEEGFDFTGTKNFDAKHGLSLALVPDGADEGPRERHHRRAATAQRQGPGDGRRRRVLGRRPASRGIAGLAGGDRAHEPAAHQSPRAAVRVVHRPHQRRDRRQVAVHERALRSACRS